ncbi:MAG: hypothetical protein GC168_05780 [Candidatus Hydrogenedens sp.]|nr:hypothetical protein [Candidatus Hydrogenedens sp.]
MPLPKPLNRLRVPHYLALKAGIFWSLILLAWLNYPADHHYSIMSHTFSFLGSWDPEHNPDTWWIFSLAMVFWGIATVPLAGYAFRRFRPVSGWGAAVGAGFMLLGGVGVFLVGLIPDARDILLGETKYTEVHEIAALMVAAGFTLSILWFAGLIVRDRFGARHFAHGHGLGRHGFAWPYLAWAGMLAVAVGNQVRWGLMYEARKAEAAAAGTTIRSSWGESLNTVYAFPLWENLVIYTLFAFLIWFTIVLHATEDARD